MREYGQFPVSAESLRGHFMFITNVTELQGAEPEDGEQLAAVFRCLR